MDDFAKGDGSVLEQLLERLPPQILESFTPEQRAALWVAANPTSWRRHPIHIRLSFPFFGEFFFLTVVGGQERRSEERVSRETRMFPLRTSGNLLFLLGVGVAFSVAAALSVLLVSSVIDF